MKSVLPLHAPLYGLPPWELKMRRISAICEVEGDLEALIPDPLEYVGNRIEVFFAEYSEVKGMDPYNEHARYLEAGVFMQAKYKNFVGGFCPYMYVNQDFSMGAREIQGFPKKMADIEFRERVIDDTVSGTCRRNDIDIISMSCQLTGEEVEMPNLFPRLLVKVIPRADGRGAEIKQVISMVSGSRDRVSKGGKVLSLEFGKSKADSLYKLKPLKTLGCLFSAANITSLPHHCTVIADLSQDKM